MQTENSKITLKVKKLRGDAYMPEYAMDSDIAFDLRASQDVTLGVFQQKEIPCGIALELPEGYVGLIRDRVGIVTQMACHAIAGTFSPGYRDEVTVVMINLAEEPVIIEKGMRIAQMIIIPAIKVEFNESNELSETDRSRKKKQ
ncbi:MAG: dUTP diphosphatase [Candidatus Woesearchaeota archaeon]